MDEKQQKILNVFRYVPANDSTYWIPALQDATVETLEYALAHKNDAPTLGKTKVKKIQARLSRLKQPQTITCHQCGSVWVKNSMRRIPKHYRNTASCGMVVCGGSGTVLAGDSSPAPRRKAERKETT